MASVRPQVLVHRGVIAASGLWFDLDVLPLVEVQQRILTLWVPGTVVQHVAGGLLLRLPTPQYMRCADAPGLPLIAAGTALLAAPLTVAELQALAPSPQALVLVRDGAALAVSFGDALREDPASWLDLSGLTIVPNTTLGSSPPAPTLLVAPPPFDPRHKFAGIPPPSPELARMLEQLRARQDRQAADQLRDTKREGGAGLWTSLRRWFAKRANRQQVPPAGGTPIRSTMSARRPFGAGLPMWLRRLFRRPAPSVEQPVPLVPAQQNVWDRLQQRAARLAWTSAVGRMLGSKHAQQMARMIAMFQRGDLDEALRNAIPLNNLPSDSQRIPMPWFRWLRRSSLGIDPRQARPAGSVGLGLDLWTDLRQLYRKAFERLETQGRLDEAAFVLAELLQANEEAVAFLERHGRLQLAAELAEARGLPPGLVVRQWFLAGQRERAVRIARRHGAWADAVLRLERSDQATAQTLRLLWAETLAEAGNYAQAVEAAWPVADVRLMVGEWIDRVLELGGVPAARMLARRLALETDDVAAFDAARKAAFALLADEEPEDAPSRRAFTDALRLGSATPSTRALARAAVRTTIRDAAKRFSSLDNTALRQLVDFAADGALRTDIPPLQTVSATKLREQTMPVVISLVAADSGTLRIYDAAILPDGRCLVALGEAGLRLVGRDGQPVAQWDQPAHNLVMSDAGDRAIVLAPRGEVQRIVRLDLLTRRATFWCQARLDSWARDYDGSGWFVGSDGDVLLIDALAEGWAALWRTPTRPSQTSAAVTITRTQEWCAFLVRAPKAGPPSHGIWERWVLELPSLTLRHRVALALPMPDRVGYYTIAPIGVCAEVRLDLVVPGTSTVSAASASEMGAPLLIVGDNLHTTAKLETGHDPLPPMMTDEWIVAPTKNATSIHCHLLDIQTRTLRAKVVLDGSGEVTIRLTTAHLLIADNLGRLLVLDLNNGQVIRNLRL